VVEKLTLDLCQELRFPVLEVTKRLPEAKALRPPKWLNDDRQRIELTAAGQPGEHILLDVLLPHRAV